MRVQFCCLNSMSIKIELRLWSYHFLLKLQPEAVRDYGYDNLTSVTKQTCAKLLGFKDAPIKTAHFMNIIWIVKYIER